MIRTSLAAVKDATFCVLIPSDRMPGEPDLAQFLPRPTGTGFFVSPDGWFVTASHVILRAGKIPDEARRMCIAKPIFSDSAVRRVFPV